MLVKIFDKLQLSFFLQLELSILKSGQLLTVVQVGALKQQQDVEQHTHLDGGCHCRHGTCL